MTVFATARDLRRSSRESGRKAWSSGRPHVPRLFVTSPRSCRESLLMRQDGYAPIEDYALIGDGRTAALVALDGSIDWMCLPNLDSPTVFGAILDASRGGTFELQPAVAFGATRRYVPNTNVLETIFTTDVGSVRVVDAMTIPDDRLTPMRELVRSIEGLSGSVPMRGRVVPRFAYGQCPTRGEVRDGVAVATWGANALALASWDAGALTWHDDAIEARFDVSACDRPLLTMSAAYAEPLVHPGRAALRSRFGSGPVGRPPFSTPAHGPTPSSAARSR